MQLQGEQLIPASRSTVWEALNDEKVLRACIPGCEDLQRTGEDSFEATVTAKIGPVKARFKGRVTLSEIDPPNGYVISGEAQGGLAAGFGKGIARVTLEDGDGGTLLRYSADAQIGGKLAQLGARLIEPVAAKMADGFFSSFNRLVGDASSGSVNRAGFAGGNLV